MEVWGREASKKIWDSYVFLQQLKLAISNLVHKLGLGLAYQKRRLGPKLAGSGLREHPKKIWDPPTYFYNRDREHFRQHLQ